ncbi:MAG: nucleoside monophosphate kinase [Candidatus Nomurabacteria bacterium]|nr:nucleoside monophosphate kinase [Candidatus Nomurabacteria bacterium]
MQSQTFVFFGIAGSGKGTQIQLLIDLLKSKDNKEIIHAYTGNEYRKIVETHSQTADLVRKVLNEGGLQPDFLTNSVFMNLLINTISEDNHIITDGYPRSVIQSEFFEKAMDFYGRKNIHIVNIQVSKEEALKRMLLRARTDDNPKAIENRCNEYFNKVLPAMEYFRIKSNYIIHDINGHQTIEEVSKDIIKSLNFEN